MTPKLSLNQTFIVSVGKVPPFLTQLFLSKVISCPKALVSSKTGLQLKALQKALHFTK